jgi:hypothetical protein
MAVKAGDGIQRVPLWAAGLLLVASCLQFDGGDAVIRSAANDAPCPRRDLAVVSRPGVGSAGTYVVEGCGQRLTYRIGVQSTRAELVARGVMGAAELTPPTAFAP